MPAQMALAYSLRQCSHLSSHARSTLFVSPELLDDSADSVSQHSDRNTSGLCTLVGGKTWSATYVLSFLVTFFFTRVKKKVTRSSAGGAEAFFSSRLQKSDLFAAASGSSWHFHMTFIQSVQTESERQTSPLFRSVAIQPHSPIICVRQKCRQLELMGVMT